MAIVLSTAERDALATALADELGAAKLQGFVQAWVGRSLDLIAPGAATEQAPRMLLEWAEREGELDRVVKGVSLDVPRTPKIAAFFKAYFGPVPVVASHSDVPLEEDPPEDPRPPRDPGSPNGGGLQAAADLNNVQMVGILVAAQAMATRARQVCKVEINSVPFGTGALIAPDRVLTAYHVVASMIENGAQVAGSAQRVRCRFDNVEMPGRTVSDGVTVAVAETWLGEHSPQHPNDGRSVALPGPPDALERLDYAIIHLAQPIGSSQLAEGGGVERGWLDLAAAQTVLTGGSTVHICQHPQGYPLQVASGLVHSHSDQRARVRYRVDTLARSSGSPCFDKNFELVAVHNAALPTEGGNLNQGVPIGLIRTHMQRGAPAAPKLSPGFRPVWRLASGAPLLGRTELQQQAWSINAAASKKRILVVKGAAKAGRTFAIEVLQALLAGRQDVVIARDMEALHDKAPEEFLVGVAKELLFPLNNVPARPTDRQSSRWASTRLIEWFVTHYAARFPPSAGAPVTVWIALDNYDRARFKDEDSIESLVQLMRATPGLETLRFLLIGDAPDANAVPSSLVVEESLPVLGVADVGTYLRAVRAAANKTTADVLVDAFAAMAVSNATAEATAARPFVIALQARAQAFGVGLPP
jgi:hypothetical protein